LNRVVEGSFGPFYCKSRDGFMEKRLSRAGRASKMRKTLAFLNAHATERSVKWEGGHSRKKIGKAKKGGCSGSMVGGRTNL